MRWPAGSSGKSAVVPLVSTAVFCSPSRIRFHVKHRAGVVIHDSEQVGYDRARLLTAGPGIGKGMRGESPDVSWDKSWDG